MGGDRPNTDEAIKKLNDEVEAHKHFEQTRSLLSKGADWLYNGDSSTFETLKRLQTEVEQAQKQGSQDKLDKLAPQIVDATAADEKALGRKQTVVTVGTDVAETAFLFMPGLRKANSTVMPLVGIVGTATVFGLDQAKLHDSAANQLKDMGLGAVKGVALKGLLHELPFKSNNPVATGMVIGTSSRFLNVGLDRQTWSKGVGEGFKTTIGQTLSSDAIKADIGLMSTAALVGTGLRKLPLANEKSLLWNNVSSGASFGIASGAQNELSRQDMNYEQRNWLRVLGAGVAKGSIDALAAVPGGVVARQVTMPDLQPKEDRIKITVNDGSLTVPTAGTIEPITAVESTTRIESAKPAAMTPERVSVQGVGSLGTEPTEARVEVKTPKIPGIQTSPVSSLLRTVNPADAGIHSVADYAAAMEGFPHEATSIKRVGSDVIAINLADGNMLKVTTRDLPTAQRDFDMPVVEQGTKTVGHVKVNYFVQPAGEPITDAQHADFVRDLASRGYWFSDVSKGNTMFYPAENRVVLVDPWAVEKLPEKPPTPVASSELKPLNAASMSDEEAGRLASNFAETPFTFRGKRYASFESFYQGLKMSDPRERSAIAKLPGKQAKAAGSKSHATETTFDGQTYTLGSPEHHQLLQEALREKFLQNPDAARALVATMPRPIIHDLGRPEEPNTRFPAADFVRMLTEIREELSKMDLSTLGRRRK